MESLILLIIILSPFVAIGAYAVYLKIKRNKAGLGPVLGGPDEYRKEWEEGSRYLDDLSLANSLEE